MRTDNDRGAFGPTSNSFDVMWELPFVKEGMKLGEMLLVYGML